MRQNDLICIAIGSSSPTTKTIHIGGYGRSRLRLSVTFRD